jgi:aminoacrylate hydrolase
MPTAELPIGSIHYKLYGEGSPVLGIMGFGLDQRYWAAQVPTITAGNRFVTFDHRGSGRSGPPQAGSLEEMAEDAVRLLDHLEIEEATIFGASMGGAVAQHLALAYPERVSALVLAITWARPIEYMRRQHELTHRLIEEMGPEALMEASLLFMFTPRFFEMGKDAIDQLAGALQAPGAPEMMSEEALRIQLDALTSHDVLDRLPKIECPTLVLGGHFDMMVPGLASEEIARAIPGAELEMFDAGHGLMFEQMEAFNARLRRFLDQQQAGS